MSSELHYSCHVLCASQVLKQLASVPSFFAAVNVFIEEHPAILDTVCTFLVTDPRYSRRLLSFENKRRWMCRQLSREQEQQPQPPKFQLHIRRQSVLHDCAIQLTGVPAEALLGGVDVHFVDEATLICNIRCNM